MPQLDQKCLTPLKVCALRFTRLGVDGAPAAGPNNSYVTSRITEISVGSDLRTGDEQELLDACGCPIVDYREDDSFKRWTISVSFGAIEFGLQEMLMGTSIILDDSTIPVPIGMHHVTPAECGASRPTVAVEAWSRAINFDAPDHDYPWFHWVWPGMKFAPAPADLTLGASAAPMVLAGVGFQNTGFGDPYADMPEPAGGSGSVFLAKTVPTPDCGYATIGS